MPWRWQQNRIDRPKRRSLSTQQDFQSHTPLELAPFSPSSCLKALLCGMSNSSYAPFPCNWAEAGTLCQGKCSAMTALFYFCLAFFFGHCIRSSQLQSNDSMSALTDSLRIEIKLPHSFQGFHAMIRTVVFLFIFMHTACYFSTKSAAASVFLSLQSKDIGVQMHEELVKVTNELYTVSCTTSLLLPAKHFCVGAQPWQPAAAVP